MYTRRWLLMTVLLGVAPAVACREGGTGLEGPAYLRPVIHEIDPPELAAGGPDTVIVVTGENFVTGSAVKWDNVELPTTKRSGRRQLEVSVPAAQIAEARQVEIRVLNRFSDAANNILGPGFPYPIQASQ
jgi:hypothetical protein